MAEGVYSCDIKHPFPSPGEAEKARRNARRRSGGGTTVFRCRFGQVAHWHLAHKDGGAIVRPPYRRQRIVAWGDEE